MSKTTNRFAFSWGRISKRGSRQVDIRARGSSSFYLCPGGPFGAGRCKPRATINRVVEVGRELEDFGGS